MICGGEGQQEQGMYKLQKNNDKRGPLAQFMIYHQSVASQELDAYKNKAREGTDPHGDVESKSVVGCMSCDIGMMAVKAARSCGTAGKM